MTALATMGGRVLCTESSEYIDTPPGLKKPLYDYQKRVVKAVLDLEAQRHIKAAIPVHLRSAKFSDYPLIAMTNACIISEPFGSGKTIETLGIIASRAPTPIYENNNAIIGDTSTMIQRQYGDRDMLSASNIGYITEIQRKYNSVVGVSIIVVGTQVLGQWLTAIKEFTEFKVFVIGNYHSLKQFIQIYRDGLTGSYDIILIKNGVVSGILDLGDGHVETPGSITSILTVVGMIMRGVACQWLVYDDFDTIRIPPGTRSLCGLFTIYISATNNDADSRNRYYATDHTHKISTTMNEFLNQRMNQVITTAVRDQILNTNFNVRSDPAFIEHSVKLPKFTAYTCSYMNPNDKLIHLLGVMGTPDATNIMEGLNADAINYVASAVGISTDPNPFNIFQKLLDKEFEKYELDCLVILAADAIEAYYKSINGMIVDHPNGHHSAADQEKIRSAIIALAKRWRGTTTRNVAPSDIKFEYSSPSVTAVIEETRREFTTKKIIDGKAIDNVKANLKEGECAVCCLPLEDIVIAKCCTITVCGICMKGSFQLRKHEDYKTKVETIVGKCPHCSKAIDMKQDLIYVTRGIDLGALVASTGVEVQPLPPPVEAIVAKPADTDALYQTDHPKLRALYDIIKGKKPKAASPTTYKMKNLIEGVVDRPFPNNLPRKILVFAGFAETLGMISDYLNKMKINAMHLGGTHLEIAKTVSEFEAAKTDTVLLVNSNQICAGLNIQFSTDIVFMHRIYNRNIEGQVAGRAQRCGRKYNLNIWFILYNNEAES